MKVAPQQVPVAVVRRLTIVGDDGGRRVQHVDVPRVPAPTVLARPELRSA